MREGKREVKRERGMRRKGKVIGETRKETQEGQGWKRRAKRGRNGEEEHLGRREKKVRGKKVKEEGCWKWREDKDKVKA